MLKRHLKLSFTIGVGLLLISGGLLAGYRLANPTPQTTVPTTTKASHPKKARPVAKLTVTELAHHPDLLYSSIIYYALKHGKIQRWQELADFKRGWQVESYPGKNGRKYLVWPDQNAKTEAKQLAPNWFYLKHHQVTYHSFVVHSFQTDQTVTVSLTEIVTQLNADHAMKKVRRMPNQLRIITHRN